MIRKLYFTCCVTVLLLASCKDATEMLTVVNPDGTCYRGFNENADAEFLLGNKQPEHNPFPVDIDSTWQISWQYKNSGLRTDFPLTKAILDSLKLGPVATSKVEGQKIKSDILVFVRKDFKSVESMDTVFRFKEKHPWKSLGVTHRLDKKFRWFYTYYIYSETYPKIEMNFEIPIDSFMTKDEIGFWFTGQPNLVAGMNGVEIREYVGHIEDKYNCWFVRNTWNAEYKELLINYDQLKNPPVSLAELSDFRDSIYNAKVKNNEDAKMEPILNEFFKTTAFSELWKGNDSPMGNFEEHQYEKFMAYAEESFDYKLILPGKIIDPGNAVLHGDTLGWNLTAYRLIPGDYALRASSRRVNIWAFFVTGIIIFLAVGSIFYRPKK